MEPVLQVTPAPAPRREPSSREPEVFPTAAAAVAALETRHGRRSWLWTYLDAGGEPTGVIVRWDTAHGKEIRPASRTAEGGWIIGGMPEPRPLYELPSLWLRHDETVYVTEGEKAADAAGWLNLLATTSPHGSASAGKADWRPLAGRDVVILPDNDDAGQRYARTVASILHRLEPPARVRIVNLPDLPPKGDLFDWLDSGPRPKDRKDQLLELVAAAPVLSPSAVQREKTTPHGPGSCPGQAPPARAGVTTSTPILQCFADIIPVPVRWLWPDRIAMGRITLLVGRPGEGKSFLTTDLAARVSTGRPWPDGSDGVGGAVIYICAEDDPADTIRPRLDAHGADVRRIHLLSLVRRTTADGSSCTTAFTLADVDVLEAALREQPDCRLVVVDPIGSFLGSGTDSYRDSDVRAILDPVGRLADVYGPAVLVVAHRRKNGSVSHADDLALGSRAFTGVSRAVWHLTRDQHDQARRLLVPGKNNLAVEGQGLAFTIAGTPPAIRWETAAVSLTADDMLAAMGGGAEGDDGRAAPLRSRAVEWLRELLAAGPLSSARVQEEARNAGFAWRTVHRAKDELAICPFRDADTADWMWRLPAVAAESTPSLFPAAACG